MTRTDVDEPHIPSVQQEQAPCFTKYTLLQMHYNIYEEKNTDLIPATCSYPENFAEITWKWLQTGRVAPAMPVSFQEPTFPDSSKDHLTSLKEFLPVHLWQKNTTTALQAFNLPCRHSHSFLHFSLKI